MYNVMKFQAPFERIKEYNTSSEVSLYKAIITQAIIDATNVSSTISAKTIEKEAKNWLFSNSNYFHEICYRAEMEPAFVIKIAKEAIELNKQRNIKQRANKPDNIKQKKMALPKELRYALINNKFW